MINDNVNKFSAINICQFQGKMFSVICLLLIVIFAVDNLKSHQIERLGELLKSDGKQIADFSLTEKIPTLDRNVNSRSDFSEIICQPPLGDEKLYDKVINEWLNPKHSLSKELIAVVGQAQIGKTELLKSFLRKIQSKYVTEQIQDKYVYDYIFYVSLKNIDCSDPMNILQFLTNQSSFRWIDHRTDQDYQFFKRIVEQLNNSKKVCIIIDDLEKSNFSLEDYKYTKSLFDKMKAGYLVFNTLKHWFKSGQKIILTSLWQYLQLNCRLTKNPLTTVYILGINFAKEIKFAFQHEPEKCPVCQRCLKTNCFRELQSLCYNPYNYNQLIHSKDHSSILSKSSIAVAALSVSQMLLSNFGRNFNSSQKITSFAWKNYANDCFVFYEADILIAELPVTDIYVFFCAKRDLLESSESCYTDLVFLFSHVFLQELLAALWLLSLSTSDLNGELNTQKDSFKTGKFDIVCDFMSVICEHQQLKSRFLNISVENIQNIKKFLGKLQHKMFTYILL